MATDHERLKGSIREALEGEQIEEQDANASLDRISDKIAAAVILEIKNMKIIYTGGLVVPGAGAVSGQLNVTIE